MLETAGFVNANRGQVFAVADHGDHAVEATCGAQVHQFQQKRLADAAAGRFRRQIDAVLDAIFIGRARAKRRGIGIAEDGIAFRRHQIGQAQGLDMGKARQHFLA